MSGQDYEQLSLFPGDSPVSRSVWPGSAEARMMTVTSGRKCLESSTSSGPLGLLEKMLLESSVWRSTRCFLTWKTKATKQGRLLFRLAVSMPRTDGTDAPSWPTPTASDWKCRGPNSHQQGLPEPRFDNMGGDADTIAAICGGLAGALHGFATIPQEWIAALSESDRARLDTAVEAALNCWLS